MGCDVAEGAEHERRHAADCARQAALSLEVRDCTSRARIARVPGLDDDLPVIRRVRSQRLRTLTVRPAEDLAADLVWAGRLRQRGHECHEKNDSSGCESGDEQASRDHAPPTAGPTWPPAPNRGCPRDREGENLPRRELPARVFE